MILTLGLLSSMTSLDFFMVESAFITVCYFFLGSFLFLIDSLTCCTTTSRKMYDSDGIASPHSNPPRRMLRISTIKGGLPTPLRTHIWRRFVDLLETQVIPQVMTNPLQTRSDCEEEKSRFLTNSFLVSPRNCCTQIQHSHKKRPVKGYNWNLIWTQIKGRWKSIGTLVPGLLGYIWWQCGLLWLKQFRALIKELRYIESVKDSPFTSH
jgi:hypothetical protein